MWIHKTKKTGRESITNTNVIGESKEEKQKIIFGMLGYKKSVRHGKKKLLNASPKRNKIRGKDGKSFGENIEDRKCSHIFQR